MGAMRLGPGGTASSPRSDRRRCQAAHRAGDQGRSAPNPVEYIDCVTKVRLAILDDLPQIARVQMRAFEDDPLITWMLPPDDFDRRATLLFDCMIRASLVHDSIYTTDDGVCTAVWAPPEAWTFSEEQLAIMAGPFAEAAGERAERAMGVLIEMAEVHPSEPHWYLEGLGTHPDWQRRGIASEVLAPVLDQCDADGLPPTSRRSERATSRSTVGMDSRSSARSNSRTAHRICGSCGGRSGLASHPSTADDLPIRDPAAIVDGSSSLGLRQASGLAGRFPAAQWADEFSDDGDEGSSGDPEKDAGVERVVVLPLHIGRVDGGQLDGLRDVVVDPRPGPGTGHRRKRVALHVEVSREGVA